MLRFRMRWTFVIAGVLQAMLFFLDGIRILQTGTRAAISDRPWVGVVEFAGIDPTDLGPVLLGYGVAWLAVTFAVLRGSWIAQRLAAALAFATFWYIVAGTGVAIVYLIAMATLRDRGEIR
ncbi:MAG: hypothetical protein GF346_04290 [Candidatus Eisenbacteria bacterium]|nr:hypothetical protein [Candidatus Latescibacterota bacterium]MBD3301646.1 hypothetical protein [Candidatus Eisenbacteria bacterium]